jgi:hypothetical protein
MGAANPAATLRFVPWDPVPIHEIMESFQQTVTMAIVVVGGKRAVDAECQRLGVD